MTSEQIAQWAWRPRTRENAAWALGYYDGFQGNHPTMDSRGPDWPHYARGYGAGAAERELPR